MVARGHGGTTYCAVKERGLDISTQHLIDELIRPGRERRSPKRRRLHMPISQHPYIPPPTTCPLRSCP